VLKAIRDWVRDEDPQDPTIEDEASSPGEEGGVESLSPRERRLSTRRDFTGHRIVIRSRRTMALLHLKDLSCHGACGITDLPIAVGAMVFLTLKKGRFHAAEVLWVRNVMAGFRFYRPLDPDTVEKIHAAHLARKASARHDHQWELSGVTPAAYPR
jgi:hypothetical protein